MRWVLVAVVCCALVACLTLIWLYDHSRLYGLLLLSPQNSSIGYNNLTEETAATPNLWLVLRTHNGPFGIKVCTVVQTDANTHWEKTTSLEGKRVDVIINIDKDSNGRVLRFNPYEVYLDIGGRKVHPSVVKGWRTDLSKRATEEFFLVMGKPVDISNWKEHYGFVLRFDATYPELESGRLCIGHVLLDDETVDVAPIRARYGSYPSSMDSPSIKGELIPTFAR